MIRKFVILFTLMAFLLNACAPAAVVPPTAAAAKKLTVITTTTILEDIVRVVAGERVTVVGLIPRNGDPHEFQPAPGDARQVAESAAVFMNGAGLEGWLEELVKNAGGERPLFVATDGLKLSTIEHGFDEAGESDPHIWMNPLHLLTVVDNVAAGLKQIDPEGAAVFDANATAYKKELQALDAWAEAELAAIPLERRKLVTAHDALGYFAARYNFKVVGYVIPSVSTETGGTSAKELGALVDTIKAEAVPVIFAEVSNNPKFIEQVAADAGVKVDELYVDSLGEPGSEAGTYLDFFRADVKKIVAGLK